MKHVPSILCLLGSGLCLTAGCTLLGGNSDPPKVDEREAEKPVEESALQNDVTTIGDIARVLDLNSVKVEGVGLVVNLDGTGSDPGYSRWRNMLMEEMKKREVENPNAVLASPDTSLVFVRGYLRPGITKGDKFDVEVFLPEGSSTTSLKGGWLLETRLSEGATIHNQPFVGHTYAQAAGPVMVASASGNENEPSLLLRGRVLGGGVSTTDRTLSMIMLKQHQTGPAVIRVERRINQRFSTYGHGAQLKEGIAKAKTNKYIQLKVAPRYKHNLPRFLDVIQYLALDENPAQKDATLTRLGEMLKEPETARRAALRLEGIGHDGKRVLKQGLENPDVEVRFYGAEALAYLGDPACARTLQEVARDEPALRVWALTALASLDDAIAHEMLVELMDGTSAETRYGAFRALWALDPGEPFIRGEHVANQFYLHELDSRGTPMIHVTRSFRPEIVLFGRGQQLKPPLLLRVGRSILVTASEDSETVRISRFAIGEKDQRVECSRNVAEVIREVAKLGATYPDIVSMLEQAEERLNLDARVEVDALPEGGRVLVRDRREVPDTRPGLFPTEYVSEPDSKSAESPQMTTSEPEDPAESVQTTTSEPDVGESNEISTEIGPAPEEKGTPTAADSDTLLKDSG